MIAVLVTPVSPSFSRTVSRPLTPRCIHSLGRLNEFSFSTATAGYASDPSTSLASSLVHAARASLIRYSLAHISDTTSTSRL
jgi:hypothetical protein